MEYYVWHIIEGLLMTGMGVLIFFRPERFRPLWRILSREERKGPADETEQDFNKIIGVGFALLGSAYTVAVVVEYLNISL